MTTEPRHDAHDVEREQGADREGAEQQGDGQPENQRELEDASGGAALAGGPDTDEAYGHPARETTRTSPGSLDDR